jgi:hypothetical protein
MMSGCHGLMASVRSLGVTVGEANRSVMISRSVAHHLVFTNFAFGWQPHQPSQPWRNCNYTVKWGWSSLAPGINCNSAVKKAKLP